MTAVCGVSQLFFEQGTEKTNKKVKKRRVSFCENMPVSNTICIQHRKHLAAQLHGRKESHKPLQPNSYASVPYPSILQHDTGHL